MNFFVNQQINGVLNSVKKFTTKIRTIIIAIYIENLSSQNSMFTLLISKIPLHFTLH